MPKGIIIGTFMPLTKGHLQLIRFAQAYVSNIYVIISTRSFEPFVQERVAAVWDVAYPLGFHHSDNKAPQAPKDSNSEKEFWDYWKTAIESLVGAINADDILFTSETYGAPLSYALGCRWIPFNQYRETISISATEIRKAPLTNFYLIAPQQQPDFRRIITFFGAESCGKTTLSKAVSTVLPSYWIPEYAREYLETFGEEITEEKMIDIWKGQFASQTAAAALEDKPCLLQDTDLLSTIGYYRIWGKEPPAGLIQNFLQSFSDLYIIMNDKIPFSPDPLRYGGDKRESGVEFWASLCQEYGVKYHIMEATKAEEQLEEALEVIKKDFYCHIAPLMDFIRG